jgi:acyl-CoA hydrolase
MTFNAPVLVGELVTLEALLTYVGRTSMEVMVRVYSENLMTGKSVLTNTAYVVYVALDATRCPTTVPGLQLETEDEHLRFEQGRERQRLRLERTQRELR